MVQGDGAGENAARISFGVLCIRCLTCSYISLLEDAATSDCSPVDTMSPRKIQGLMSDYTAMCHLHASHARGLGTVLVEAVLDAEGRLRLDIKAMAPTLISTQFTGLHFMDM